MPLTPADVHNLAFSKPPIGKRGYNESEVDAFLDLVGAELARLIKENDDLHNRVSQLCQQLRAAPTDTGRSLHPLVPPPKQTSPAGDHHAQAAKVLGLAQQIADRLTRDAKAEADQMLCQARTTTQQLLSETQAKADGMVDEARTRAQTMLHDAHGKAEDLDRQSRERATALEHEAARKHTEILGAISQEKNILEHKIDELRTIERDYRSRLKAYLSTQLRELDNRVISPPVDPARSRHSVATPEPEDPLCGPNIGTTTTDTWRAIA
ncbi:MAG: DivIVA-like cell division protein Wag31 [Pseudonocardiaceae bacterium]